MNPDEHRPIHEGPVVVYTFREVLERLEAKIDRLSEQLDKDLEGLENRVSDLETFRARFIPMTALVGLVAVFAVVFDVVGHWVHQIG